MQGAKYTPACRPVLGISGNEGFETFNRDTHEVFFLGILQILVRDVQQMGGKGNKAKARDAIPCFFHARFNELAWN